MITTIDHAIIKAIARTLFDMAWADYQERELEHGLRGEIDNQAPETPDYVLHYAYFIAGRLAEMNGKTVFYLLREAAKADGKQPEEYTDNQEICERFGHCLAMTCTGQGVSWFDDHEDFPLKFPYCEFSYLDLDPEQYPTKDDSDEGKLEAAVAAAKKKLQDATDAEVLAMVTGKDATEASTNIASARHELLVALKRQKELGERSKLLKGDGLDRDLQVLDGTPTL